MRSTRVHAVLGLGAFLLVATPGTFAYWTEEATITGTTFTAGSIDLGADAPASTTMNLATMVPGNSTAGVLTIHNNGTAPLKYTATTAGSNADSKGLASALVVSVTGAASVTGSLPAVTCGGTALSGTGTGIGGGLVTTGRLLAAGASETLCVQVTLPTNANTSLQGATTAVTFTFTATSDIS